MGTPSPMLLHQAMYPNVEGSASIARGAIVAFARSAGFAGAQLQDLELAVGEALANAVEHGRSDNGSIFVGARFEFGKMTIEISDSGGGFAGWNNVESLPRKAESVRGFGLRIMHETTDGVQFLDGGRRVRLTKKLVLERSDAPKQEEL
jgi:serine/threonine-protein kinase RsbW